MNAKAAEDPSAVRLVMSQPIREELEETGQEEQADPEEEKLRSSLQNVLNASAGSLGLSVQTPQQGAEASVEAQEIVDSEDDSRSKRQRSQDPGAASRGTSVPS